MAYCGTLQYVIKGKAILVTGAANGQEQANLAHTNGGGQGIGGNFYVLIN